MLVLKRGTHRFTPVFPVKSGKDNIYVYTARETQDASFAAGQFVPA